MKKTRLKVYYLIKGNLEADMRSGRKFRWRIQEGGHAHVFQYDRRHRVIWTKSYADIVTIEVKR